MTEPDRLADLHDPALKFQDRAARDRPRSDRHIIVIPEHDRDPVHSTDRYRATAKPKYSSFSHPLPDVAWPTLIPVTATEHD